MWRTRFASGLGLGFLLGLIAGIVFVRSLSPEAREDRVSDIQVQELTRRLEAARVARERADQQLEQFAKLAEQMTRSFEALESRFKRLDAELGRDKARENGSSGKMPDQSESASPNQP